MSFRFARLFGWMTFAASFAFVTPCTSGAEPRLVARWAYGPSRAVALSESLVYLSSGSVLMAVDVSLIENPRVVGELVFPDLIQYIEVYEDLLLVASDQAGLFLADAVIPESLRVLARVETPGPALHVIGSGDFAYVSCADGGLIAVDLGTPSSPVVTATIDTDDEIRELEIAGSFAYAAEASRGVRILDIGSPALPQTLSWYDDGGGVRAISVAGERTAVLDDQGRVKLLDIGEPSAPVQLGVFPAALGFFGQLELEGVVVRCAGSMDYFLVDFGDPTQPSQRGYVALESRQPRFARDELHLFVADGHAGLRVFEAQNPALSGELARVDSAGSMISLASAGPYVYLTEQDRGVRVLDLSSPMSPTAIGAVATGSVFPYQMELNGAFGYFPTGPDGIHVIDLSDPAAPQEIAVFGAREGWVYEVIAAGDFAYARWGSLRIYDMSSPGSLVELARLERDDSVYGGCLAYSGSFAFQTTYHTGFEEPTQETDFEVIDVSDPALPVVVGSVAPEWPSCYHATYADKHVYLATQEQGLAIVDVSDATDPRVVATLDLPGRAEAVAVRRNCAVVAAAAGGLRVIDVSDPHQPAEVGMAQVAGNAEFVTVAGNSALVAGGETGFWEYDLSTFSCMMAERVGLRELATD